MIEHRSERRPRGRLYIVLAAVGVEPIIEGEMFQGRGVIILPIVALIMVVVGLAAAFGPARAGLRIQPIEALREE